MNLNAKNKQEDEVDNFDEDEVKAFVISKSDGLKTSEVMKENQALLPEGAIEKESYLSSDFQKFCRDTGTIIEYNVSGNPDQNGVNRRMNGHIMNMHASQVSSVNVFVSICGKYPRISSITQKCSRALHVERQLITMKDEILLRGRTKEKNEAWKLVPTPPNVTLL
ncbi:hypothetical protein JTB14_022276 [Gonioctena quinquepunctata]|nr:hypothetical protein JTB14_022276 [Gonioctena quinquepunctata]